MPVPECRDFEFEKLDLNIEQLKDLAYEEVVSRHFPKMAELLEERLKKKSNPYQEIYENENFGFDDKEDGGVASEEEGDEDSFELGD